jgi:hypothetical protein
MLGFVKMSGLSAVLSFALVTGYGHVADPAAPAASAKPYQQRLGDASPAPLAAETAAAASDRKADRIAAVTREHVRFVTVESREGVNVSVLRRVPQTDVALR